MNADKNLIDNKGSDIKKVDVVETPTPPQHMDPSKMPVKENEKPHKKKVTK